MFRDQNKWAGCADRGSMQQAKLLSHPAICRVLMSGSFTPALHWLRASNLLTVHVQRKLSSQPSTHELTWLSRSSFGKDMSSPSFASHLSREGRQKNQSEFRPSSSPMAKAASLPATWVGISPRPMHSLSEPLDGATRDKGAGRASPVPSGTCEALCPSRDTHLRPLYLNELVVVILNVMKT